MLILHGTADRILSIEGQARRLHAALPQSPLVPTLIIETLIIELAPPVVAGTAWFAVNVARPDTTTYVLAGYAVLMVFMQLRLLQLSVRVPFVDGVWAYGFTSAAAVGTGIRWLAAEQVAVRQPLTYALLAVVSLPALLRHRFHRGGERGPGPLR